MAKPNLDAFAKSSNKSLPDVKKAYDKALTIAKEDLGKEEKSFSNKDWTYVMGITKNILKIKECNEKGDNFMKRKRFIETNLSAMDYLKRVAETLTSASIPRTDSIKKKQWEEYVPEDEDDVVADEIHTEDDVIEESDEDLDGDYDVIIEEEDEFPVEDDEEVIEEEDEFPIEDEDETIEEEDEFPVEDDEEVIEEEDDFLVDDDDEEIVTEGCKKKVKEADDMNDVPSADVPTDEEEDFTEEDFEDEDEDDDDDDEMPNPQPIPESAKPKVKKILENRKSWL